MKRQRKRPSDRVTDAEYIERLRAACTISPTGCWLYGGYIHYNGYGDMSYRGKNIRVHKLSYILHKGAVPAGYDVCHTCDVRHCVNPDHLWVGTRQQNVDDMTAKRRHANTLKDVCKRGHEFTPDNTYYDARRGKRHCRACHRRRLRMVRLNWTEQQASSLPATPMGKRPVNRNRPPPQSKASDT